MSYSEQAAVAKAKARDILRTQMAIRIQERLADAKSVLRTAVNGLAALYAEFADEDKDLAKHTSELAADRDAFRQALGATPGITPEEIQDATDTFEASIKQVDADLEKKAERRATRRADQIKRATDELTEARDLVKKTEENLVKCDAGELKVDKQELLDLANTLLAEGGVDEGEAETV